MISQNTKTQLLQKISEVLNLIAEIRLPGSSYKNETCILLSIISVSEEVLLTVANVREQLSEGEIALEERIFDEWLLLYNICKAALMRKSFTHEIQALLYASIKRLEEHLSEFEKEIA